MENTDGIEERSSRDNSKDLPGRPSGYICGIARHLPDS